MNSLTHNHNIIDLIDMEYCLNDRNTSPRRVPICIAAAVYRMSAGNCMPNTNHKSFSLMNHQSPWETYRRHKKAEDSSLEDSTCSSRSDSPEPKPKHNKKRSTHLLLREIHRLRGENATLRDSVSILKNDLRDIALSRKDTDASHRRFYEEYIDRNAQLENDVQDRDDEIARLRKEIEQLKSTQHSTFENEQEINHDEQQAIDDYFHRRHMDYYGYNNHFLADNEEDEDDDDEEDDDTPIEPFEEVASSYLHQAMLSKLSSARVRLELDDLICKYEPTSTMLIDALTDSFVRWIGSLIQKNERNNQPMSVPKLFTTKVQEGIAEFWESIFQHYLVDDNSQQQLLFQIETVLSNLSFGMTVAEHFDRLVLLLFKHLVIDDDALISWWEHPFDDEVSQKIRKTTTRFVEWVQDSDDESDGEDEDEDEEDEEDDDDVFSFVESPVPEDAIELDVSDNEMNHQPQYSDGSIDDLLNNNMRHYCVCLSDNDTSNNSLNQHECSCSTYTPSPVPEKKKKSVRIAM
ncbi:hypothetical protein BD560DRAFT_443411 [Blakeslea trispora]|nr:hypothetical protein BD560DRAFT_443411 [Blakeslea trispora]